MESRVSPLLRPYLSLLIAVPVMMGKDASILRKMVMEVNRNEVHPEDVLSENVYIYRREQDRLEIA